MSNSNKTVILDSGLNQVNNWGIAGTYSSVKYFLPVYDPSIDDKIHSSTQTLTSGVGTQVRPLSASIISTQTSATLQGEKLWNANSSIVLSAYNVALPENVYSISTSDKFVITSATNIQHGHGYNTDPIVTSGVSISGSSQTVGNSINLIGGIYSLSQSYSASNLAISSTGNNGTIFTGNIQSIPIAPNIQLSNANMLYPVRAFVPVNVSADVASVDAGRYIVQLDASTGNFRFNKIIFYLAKMNLNGTEDTSYIPTPFAQLVWEGTTRKQRSNSNNSGVVWEGIIDLIFQRNTGTENLTYLNVDNWTFMDGTFGLSTVNDVKIYSSGIPANINNDAKLEVYDNVKKQLKLAYNLDKYSYLWTDTNNKFNISASSMQLKSIGSLIMEAGQFNFIGNSEFLSDVIFNDSVSFNSSADFFETTTFHSSARFTDVVNFTDIVNFTDVVNFTDSVTFDNGVNFRGAVTFNEPINIDDISNFNAHAIFNSSATFYNDVTFEDNVYFDDVVNFNAVTTFNDTATFDGGVAFNDAVLISGPMNVDYISNFNQPSIYNSSATYYNDVTFNDYVFFNDIVNFNEVVSFNNSTTFEGGVLFRNSVTFNEPISIDDTASFNQPAFFTNNVSLGSSVSADSIDFGHGGKISYQIIDGFSSDGSTTISASTDIPLSDKIIDIRSSVAFLPTPPSNFEMVFPIVQTSAYVTGTLPLGGSFGYGIPGVNFYSTSASSIPSKWIIRGKFEDNSTYNQYGISANNYRAIVWYRDN